MTPNNLGQGPSSFSGVSPDATRQVRHDHGFGDHLIELTTRTILSDLNWGDPKGWTWWDAVIEFRDELQCQVTAGAGVQVTHSVQRGLVVRASMGGVVRQLRTTLGSWDSTVDPDRVRRARDVAMSACSGAAVDAVSVELTTVAVDQDSLHLGSDTPPVVQSRSRSRAVCLARGPDSSPSKVGFSGPGVQGHALTHDEGKVQSVVESATNQAVRLAHCRPLPQQRSGAPIAFLPGCGGVLAHEIVGHALEGDNLRKGVSPLLPHLGANTPVADPDLSVIEDPGMPGLWSSAERDDEAHPVVPTALVNQGKVAAAIDDRTMATSGRPLPGAHIRNGRRTSFAHDVLPRMTNTYITASTRPGDTPGSTDGANRSLDGFSGLVIRSVAGGSLNPGNGRVRIDVREAETYRDGVVESRHCGLTLVGSCLEVLGSIRVLDADLRFEAGMCSRGGQPVPVSYGSPTLVVTGLQVRP